MRATKHTVTKGVLYTLWVSLNAMPAVHLPALLGMAAGVYSTHMRTRAHLHTHARPSKQGVARIHTQLNQGPPYLSNAYTHN